MAIYIKNDSLDNLNQSLQFLAQQNSQRKARDIELAGMLNRQGKNKEAEELLLSSQRGLFGNLFGKDAEEWTPQGVYRQPDAPIKEVTDMQGSILSSLADPKSPDYNPEQIALMAKEDQKTSGLAGLLDTTNKFKSQIDNYNRQKADGTVNYNNQAVVFNKANSQYAKSYTGNEVDQHQSLMNDTLQAMDNTTSDQDKLKAYNKYITTGKAISDHYGHRFDAQSPIYFGIGGGGKGSGNGKNEKYHITLNDKSERNVQLPAGVNPDSDTGRKMIMQLLKIKDEDFAHGSVQPDNGDSAYLNPAEQVAMENNQLVNAKVKNDLVENQIDKYDGLFTSRATAEKKLLDDLAKEGKTVATDQYGYKTIIPFTNTQDVGQQNNQKNNQQTPPATNYKSLYMRK